MADRLIVEGIIKINGSPLKSLNKITEKLGKSITKTETRTEKLGTTAKKTSKKLNKMMDSYRAKANKASGAISKIGGALASIVGIGAITLFAKGSVDLAKKQLIAEIKLNAVLMNTKGMTQEKIKSIKLYASELQNLGVIGDEVTIAGVQQLGTFQLQAKTLKILMPAMGDLLAQTKGLNASQGDAVNIGNLLGKVMTGQTSALSRVGINFSEAQKQVLKYGTEQEKASTLAKVLKMNVGGVNEALAKTDIGKTQQTANAFGDMREEIGKRLIPIIAKFSGALMRKLPKIQNFLIGIVEKFSGIYEAVKNSVLFIDKYSTAFKILIGTLIAFKSVSIAVFAIERTRALFAFATAIPVNFLQNLNIIKTTALLLIQKSAFLVALVASKAFTAGQYLLNIALNANPIMLVITALTALGAGFYTAYNTVKPFRDMIDSLWQSLKKIGSKVFKFIFGSDIEDPTAKGEKQTKNRQLSGASLGSQSATGSSFINNKMQQVSNNKSEIKGDNINISINNPTGNGDQIMREIQPILEANSRRNRDKKIARYGYGG